MEQVNAKMTRIPGGWQCTECPMNSKYTTTVKRHIESKHLSHVNHYCSICEVSFTTSDKLNRHVKNSHHSYENLVS